MVTGQIDKRTLTNEQRVAMGLPPRQSPGKRGPIDPTVRQRIELEQLRLAIASGEIAPASVRLAEQLRAMLGKWSERGIQ